MVEHSFHKKEEGAGDLYKGLFFGMLIGVALVWFLSTDEGKKLKKEILDKGEEFLEKAKEAADKAVSEPIAEEISEEASLPEGIQAPPARFFSGGNPAQ